MLDREEILVKAIEDCFREMFAKAQPMADWDNLIAEYKAGKIDEKKDGPVYDRHYLSQEEYIYILNKYLEAYHIGSEWKEDIELLEDYLKNGGSKDKYIDSYTDENGNYHSGYRGYEKVAPLKEHIENILYKYIDTEEETSGAVNAITNKVMEIIKTCKEFYNFNTDEMKFRNTLAMGASPTSNKETVKKWWKDHYDVDIEIEERNPLLFWDQDYYGDNFEEVMEEENGPDWKERLDKKWKDDIAKKEAEREKRLKELQEKYEKEKNETKE